LAIALLSLPLAAAVVWQVGQLRAGLRRGAYMAQQAYAVQSRPAQPSARVLMLGDSTGVGVGAGSPEATLPGLLAAEFPSVEIVNRCENGARVADAIAQLASSVDGAERFDLVLVLVGGNDVLALTPLSRLAQQAELLLDGATRVAPRTVWLGSANIGGSPRLLPPLAWWLGRRTQQVMRLLARQARGRGVEFIDFFQPRQNDLFSRNAGIYFADDGLHPSAASYKHSFDTLLHRAPLRTILQPDMHAHL